MLCTFEMATILSLYDKSKPAHCIPQSPLQVLLCALYMKGCDLILLHCMLCTFEMATKLSLYDKSKPAHSIPQSPLQVLLCALYMKGCYFIQ